MGKPRREKILKIRRELLAWYRRHGRDLPWRRIRDPYAIWVSEIMLQQTRVETVIPYYERFLRTFPTVHSLSRATAHKVLKLWEGLGYYARARNLHRGAKVVAEEWNGSLPARLEELTRIPGIGRSTAGAILSLAFEVPTPILDGNVKRVLCRLFAIREDPKSLSVEKRLWALSDELTPKGKIHDYTQAIMDLGAMICLPRDPVCDRCPLRRECEARRLNLQGEIPLRKKKKASPHFDVALGVIRKRGRILIFQRPAEGLLGGLWGFPNYRSRTRKGLPKALREGIEKDYGISIESDTRIGAVSHAYSHFKITLHVFDCSCKEGERITKKVYPSKWVYPAGLAKYPLAATDLKIIKLILRGRKQGAVFNKKKPT
jgi:A/G-specific adenine glycosylase